MILSEEQQNAKVRIEKGENLCIMAEGGFGKSHLLKSLDQRNSVLVAPTGVAALNVGGSTMHKVFSLPIGEPTDADKYKIPFAMKKLFTGNKIKTIFIDEVFMARPDYLDILSCRLKTIKGNNKDFGGLNLVCFGDPFQIEPIVKPDEKRFWEKYDSRFAFSAKCWDFDTVELTIPFRTTNLDQLEILSSIRTKKDGWEQKFDDLLDISKEYPKNNDVLHLCVFKNDAETINRHHFNKIAGNIVEFKGRNTGKEPFKDSELPIPLTQQLKVGCKVLVKANSQDGSYVNGDQGLVISLGKDYADVELRGSTVRIFENKWEKFAYENGEKVVVGRYTQIPLLLGWGITIHSCQGMTLDDAVVDVGRGCFAHGLFYVAVSRLRDLRNLGFINKNQISYDNVIVRQEVIDYYQRIRNK